LIGQTFFLWRVYIITPARWALAEKGVDPLGGVLLQEALAKLSPANA